MIAADLDFCVTYLFREIEIDCMAGCLIRLARSAGDIFTDSTANDILLSSINGTSSSAILAGFTPAGGVTTHSLLRIDPTAGLVVSGNLSVAGQNTITSNLVCTTLGVAENLTLGPNSVSFTNGAGGLIDASSWSSLRTHVYSPSKQLETPVYRTLFTSAAQNHSAYVENGSVYMFGHNDHGQLGLGDLVDRVLPTRVPGVKGAATVACGQGFTVILLTSGAALSMGSNAYGQLGDGTVVDKRLPTAVQGVSGAVAVVAGCNHTLFLLSSGVVAGFGSSSVGQLGAGTSSLINKTLVTTTMPVPPAGAALSSCYGIFAGAYHSIILLLNGTTYSFGDNSYSQLGLGTTTQMLSPTLVSQPPGAFVVNVGTGQFHSLLVLSDGSVMSCGRNDLGQCGVGNTNSPLTTWTTVVGPQGSPKTSVGLATSVVGGAAHTVVKQANGTVWVFGSNAMGQLGLGNAVSGVSTPTKLIMSYAVYTAYSISAGANHTVIVLNNDPSVAQKNRVVAFGDNTFGQVGTALPPGGVKSVSNPQPISDGAPINGKKLMVGPSGCCAYIDIDGTVYIWGSNSYGQIGDGTIITRPVAGAMAALNFATRATKITNIAGGGNFTVALDCYGTLYTWGCNSAGQLGVNSTVSYSVPQIVSTTLLTGKVIVSVSTGAGHCIALDSQGGVYAWGLNDNGQVGAGSVSSTYAPVCVSSSGSLNGTSLVSVAAGSLTSAAIDSTGNLHVWGWGSALGLGQATNSVDQLLPVVNSTGSLSGVAIVSVSQGYSHGAALDSAGGVHAWGLNSSGQIGDGTTIDRRPPVQVSNVGGSSLQGKVIVLVACGDMHTLALDSTGGLHAWGKNYTGQVGNGSTSDQWLPVSISAKGSLFGKTVVAATASYAHSIAMDSSGGIHVWGRGLEGQNGTNTLVNQSAPVLQTLNTRNLNPPMFSRGGLGETKLLQGRTSDTTVLLAVGANSFGQVGDGTTATRLHPVTLPSFPAPVSTCSSGLFHCGATLTDGSAFTWGLNTVGQCSGPSLNNVISPTLIPSIHYAASICCGSNCSFLTLGDGSVVAFGDNTQNQLGLSEIVPLADTSAPVPLLDYDARSIHVQVGASLGTWDNAGSLGTSMQATAFSANQTTLPTLGTAGLFKHVVFDGTKQQYLSLPQIQLNGLYNPGAKGGLTFFIVAQAVSPAVMSQHLFDFGNGPASDNIILRTSPRWNRLQRFSVYNQDIDITGSRTDFTLDGNFHLNIITIWNGDSAWNIQVAQDSPSNIMLRTMGSGGSFMTNRTLSSNFIGRSNTPGDAFFSGKIRKFTIYDHVLSDGEMAKVMTTMPWNVSSTPIPIPVGGLSNIVQLASGGGSSLALNSSGNVYSWGTNTWGATGQGTFNGSTVTPTLVDPSAWNSQRVTRIAAGDGISALITADGSCFTCGVNTEGALGQSANFGNGSVSKFAKVTDPASAYPTGFGNAVVDVSCGARHTVVQLANNTIRVMGANSGRQLKGLIGANQWQPTTPTQSVSSPVVAISASANMTLEENSDRTTSSIGGLSSITKLMMGGSAMQSSFLVTPLGVVHAWGQNYGTQPVSLSNTGSFSSAIIIGVSAGLESQGNGAWVIALDTVGCVHTFGVNNFGQLGNGSTAASPSPTLISSVSGSSLVGVAIVQVQAGSKNGVALDSTGAVHTWGYNGSGQLGDGTNTNRSLPFQIMNVPGSSLVGQTVTSVSTGGYHTLAVDSNGCVHAWGRNDRGELGNNTISSQNLPTLVSNNPGGSMFGQQIVAVAGGWEQSFAIDSKGSLHAWGQNSDGRLGTGDMKDMWTSVLISNNGSLAGRIIVAVACGSTSTAALDSTGQVHIWGSNSSGNLGDSTWIAKTLPISPMQGALTGIRIMAITAGDAHYIALGAAGEVITWGFNSVGQVGNGNTYNKNYPLQISGMYGQGSLYGDVLSPTFSAPVTPFFVNFTGQHRVFMAADSVSIQGSMEGLIVVSDQNDYITATGSAPTGVFDRGQNAITVNDTLPMVSLAKAAYDERVFGVLSSSVFRFCPVMGLSEQQSQRLVEVGDIRMEVNAVGAGAIWVVDFSGPLVSGNLICSSGVPGYGMRQADPMPKVFQTFTVAKATCDCDFTAPQQPVLQIQLDADGLNMLDSRGAPLWVASTASVLTDSTGAVVSQQAQNEMSPAQQQALTRSTVTMMEAKYKMRWLQADGTNITRAQYNTAMAAAAAASSSSSTPPLPVYRAALIGCTYHCG